METPFLSTSSAPQPGTGATGDWSDFVNSVVRGVGSVIGTVKAQVPAATGGWGGSTSVPTPAARSSSSGMGILVVILLIVLVVE